ncbi:MOSC domain-containing protein [Dactylosporangium sp. NPDC051541]|uniref:MOSC domain-containing protein n=1 Tax=Dactylosporangium sp. NPDC051541 TaxID=3363977 RepID=UPI00379C5616
MRLRIVEIRRYPVKSMLGETLPAAAVDARGLAGDRQWAVRGTDGKFGSGKTTRRFRRMDGLFRFRAFTALPGPAAALLGPDAALLGPDSALFGADGALSGAGDRVWPPLVELPDGRRFKADDPLGHHAISAVLGHTVTMTPEARIPHHDEGPISIITTAALRALTALGGTELDGTPAAATRFRANLLIDTPESTFIEDNWLGRRLQVGPNLVLRVVRPLTRCVMIDLPQESAHTHSNLLKLLATHHNMEFGVFATVERPGAVTLHDECRVQ